MGEYTDKDIIKSLARAIELLTEENKAFWAMFQRRTNILHIKLVGRRKAE